MDFRRTRGRRRLIWLAALWGAVLLAGCSFRRPQLPTIPPQLAQLSAEFDEYLIAYRERYQIGPRPASDPLGVAEAYLRQYQPGPLPRVFQTTILYDRNGVKLAEIIDEGYRTWVPLNRISPHLLDAIIATEDATFYSNPGYDPRRVLGAMMQNAEAGEVVSGASTITMQLARNLFFTPRERFEQSMERKAFEALLAQDLTHLYTKGEILEMYLNLVHFGRQLYGVEAAANFYFGKSAAELTLAEATLLAGIPQKPADYDLFTNFNAVKQRQRVVLDLMVRHGFLKAPEADFVFAQSVKLNDNIERPPVLAPHFVQYVTAELNERLGDLDIRRAGMRVFTTLDIRMQELAQGIVREQVAKLQPQFNLSNAALVALKPGTAEVLAMVGSADFNNPEIDGQVNVAVRLRQPGSAIKPILYAIALDDNLISPATIIWDVPARYKLSDTDEYRPRNYDDQFHGPVTVRTALANSYNIPAVKLLDAVGVERMLAGARAMGIQSLTRDTDWYGLSLTLGGGEVTLLDLTTAYHTLANGGRYKAPQAILFTTGGPPGTDIAMDTGPGEQVIAPQSAYLVTHILSDNEARSLEFGSESMLKLSRPNAAKTGTTTDWRDNWTEGYTRYLVAGVWAGNSDGRPMRNASGITGAAPIWHTFMEAVLADPALLQMLGAPADPAAWEFVPPPDIVTAPIECPQGITCNETELFSRRWLARMGELGPQGDSVITANMRAVYVDRGNGQRAIGACSALEGEERRLLRMPFGLTRTLPEVAPELIVEARPGSRDPLAPPIPQRPVADSRALLDTLGTALNFDLDEERLRRIRQEQAEALSWGGRNRQALYLGPCDEAENVARFMYGDAVRRVVVAGATEQLAVEMEESQREADGRGVLAAAAPPPASGSSSYAPLGVAHDANCGGNMVLGQVVNAQGQPVAGVTITYSDPFGNIMQTATSGSPQGYGSFSFRIAVPDQAHTITITAAGGSAAASVPHLQGGPTDQGCHYVIWRGAD
ncbi:MAG TPA: transglycosylase domain-containing protein [Caldilineaceae bacterium]|nr:transglycosylase domain-containing protein [Caldilineaceae bacterium]